MYQLFCQLSAMPNHQKYDMKNDDFRNDDKNHPGRDDVTCRCRLYVFEDVKYNPCIIHVRSTSDVAVTKRKARQLRRNGYRRMRFTPFS